MPNLLTRGAVTQAFSRFRQYLGNLSLQSRFLLIMGASSLFITLLFFALFTNFTENLLERIGERFAKEQMLLDKARTLQPLMREMVFAREAAEAPLLKAWVADEGDPELYGHTTAELSQLFHSANYFVAIIKSGKFYYFDAKKQRNWQPKHQSMNPSAPEDAWIYDFIKSGDSHTIKVTSNNRPGLNRIWIMVPIRAGKKTVGVLGTGIDISDFTHNATNTHLPGVTNMFIDRNAKIQIYNDVTHWDFPGIKDFSEKRHLYVQILGATAGSQWLQQSIKKLEAGHLDVETDFVQIEGKRYLAGLTALPEVGWYDLSLLDLSILLPRTDFIRIGLAIIAGTLLLLGILAFTLHKLVLKPVALLTDAVSRIRRGDYSSKPAEKSSGEVRELLSQFSYMADSIYNTQQWLETEIEKRTQQLSDAQQILEISLQHERNGRETQANLMALMAHEMRSPIAVIGNTAQMLEMLVQNEHPEWLPRIEKIMRSVRQLSLLMDNFLTEKWLDMDKRGLNRETGNLNQLCSVVAESFMENQVRHVNFELLRGDASICADWQLLRIAVINLLDNAGKYSAPTDEITLRVTACQSDWLCVEVSDKGVGMPPELQQHVFEKFARGRHESSIRGSGLGLYLVNWIARFHGGRMDVTSVEGEGSTFCLCLPVCEPEPVEVKSLPSD